MLTMNRGCDLVVEDLPCNEEVTGLNPTECRAITQAEGGHSLVLSSFG